MSDFIPEQIQVQILKRLPVFSLLNARCVCKGWKKLIDSSFFLLEHLAVQNPGFILAYESHEFLVLEPRARTFHTLEGPFQDDDDDEDPDADVYGQQFHLIGTLHGVVCLSTYMPPIEFLLWNPAICMVMSIILPQDLIKFHFGGYKFGNCYGFWIDPSTKDFKVVVFKLKYGVDAHKNGALYSSIQQGWKLLPLDDLIGSCASLQDSPPVVIKGVAYWNSYRDLLTYQEGKECNIDVVVVSFDFEHERFGNIVAPSVKHLRSYNPVLYNWQDTLSLVYLDMENSKRCEIHLRQDDSWVKVFTVSLTSCMGLGLGQGLGLGRVLCVPGETEEIEENITFLAAFNNAMLLCDPKGGFVPLKTGLMDEIDFFVANDFVESLLFPNHSGCRVWKIPGNGRR